MTDAALLDQVQNWAARWAKGKSKFESCSVSALQSELGWLPLSERRRHHRLSILYKIRNGLLAISPEAIDLVPNSRPGKHCKYVYKTSQERASSTMLVGIENNSRRCTESELCRP